MRKGTIIVLPICVLLLLILLNGCFGGRTPVSRGGLLYDNWWKFTGADAPDDDHPLWAEQAANSRSGDATWRCKECHGWDYLGKDGAYSSGSHYTGFPGIYDAARGLSAEELAAALKGSTNTDHDFSSVMDDKAIGDLVAFMKEGIVDVRKYIDYDAKTVIGADSDQGKELYDESCGECHGDSGTELNFGSNDSPVFIGSLANGNPWETLHKIRFGSSGAKMTSSVDKGKIIRDAADILEYAQTLAAE